MDRVNSVKKRRIPAGGAEVSPEMILESRKCALDQEEQERAIHTPIIFRVDQFSKEVKKKHFTPAVVSLGLFDRYSWNNFEDTIQKRENLKLDVAISFFADIGKDPSADWKEISQLIVEDASAMMRCYDDFSSFDDSQAEFVRSALALDAIFVTSYLMCAYGFYSVKVPVDITIFKMLARTCQLFAREAVKLVNGVFCDIFKLENQIPLLLVRNTIRIVQTSFYPGDPEYDVDVILECICCTLVSSFRAFGVPNFRMWKITMDDSEGFRNCHHVLHCLAYALWNGARLEAVTDEAKIAFPVRDYIVKNSCLFFAARTISNASYYIRRLVTERRAKFCGAPSISTRPEIDVDDFFGGTIGEAMVTATDLHKNGITFKARSGFYPRLVPGRFCWWRASLFLPQIPIIHENTEQFWRNLLAFELAYIANSEDQLFGSYLTFMTDLVNTKEDASLLCTGRDPIIPINHLEDHQRIAELFSYMVKGHFLGRIGHWNSLRREIMRYHNWELRVQIVEFMDTYFGRPWLVSSVIAGFTLLILTFVQSFYAIITYYNRRS